MPSECFIHWKAYRPVLPSFKRTRNEWPPLFHKKPTVNKIEYLLQGKVGESNSLRLRCVKDEVSYTPRV